MTDTSTETRKRVKPPRPTNVVTHVKQLSLRRAIYDGRTAIGSIAQYDHGWIAFDQRGQELGTFNDYVQAANAVSDAASGAVP